MTSALRWGWVVSTTPRPLYPRERPGTHCTGDGVGPRAGLDGWGKSRPPSGFDPQTAQPIVSRYTNYAILAHTVDGAGEFLSACMYECMSAHAESLDRTHTM